MRVPDDLRPSTARRLYRRLGSPLVRVALTVLLVVLLFLLLGT